MKSEKDIKSEEYGKLFVPDSSFSVSNMVAAFSSGYTQAQKDLLAEASEGFEEWYKLWSRAEFPSLCKEAWQASRLPLMKKVEELRSVIKIKDEFMQASVCLGRLEEVQKENEELGEVLSIATSEAIGWLEKVETEGCCSGKECGCLGKPTNREYYDLQYMKEIRTKFSLDKNDKGAV